jgi:hypothetical protein
MIQDVSKAEFTIDEITSYTGADPVLIGKATQNLSVLADHFSERIMRSLIVSDLFTVTSGNTYKPNDSAWALSNGGALNDMITFIQYVCRNTFLV